MKEVLLSKGLKFETLEDGNWYWIKFEDVLDEEMIRLLQIFGMSENEYFDFAILQCNEKFEQCSLMVDYEIYDLTLAEFKSIVEQL